MVRVGGGGLGSVWSIRNSRAIKLDRVTAIAMSFLRDVPTLQVLILKQIANTPTKCIHEDGCLKLLDALEKGCFQGTDIVQKLVDYITIAGRMTDDAIPPVLLRQRSTLSLTNSKISGEAAAPMPLCPVPLLTAPQGSTS